MLKLHVRASVVVEWIRVLLAMLVSYMSDDLSPGCWTQLPATGPRKAAKDGAHAWVPQPGGRPGRNSRLQTIPVPAIVAILEMQDIYFSSSFSL